METIGKVKKKRIDQSGICFCCKKKFWKHLERSIVVRNVTLTLTLTLIEKKIDPNGICFCCKKRLKKKLKGRLYYMIEMFGQERHTNKKRYPGLELDN